MQNKLAIGTAQFGLDYGVSNFSGRTSPSEVQKILSYARTIGISVLDTAVAYGNSETQLGAANVQGFDIVSKLPPLQDNVGNIEKWCTQHVSESLSKLKIAKLHAVLLHKPADLLGSRGAELLKALKLAQEMNFTHKIGYSIYSVEELPPLLNVLVPELLQVPFNILDTKLVSTGWADRLKQMNVEIHVRSIFLQGLLLMMPSTRPEKFLRWSNLWKEWDSFLHEANLTEIEACVRFAHNFPQLDRIIVGVENCNQLAHISSIGRDPLPSLPSWRSKIEEALISPSLWSTL